MHEEKRLKKRLEKAIESGDHFNKFDCILFVILAGFCYISFLQSDIIVTGNRSWQLWNSNFFDYYDVLHAYTDNYGANYLFSTFFLFAVWNLPLKWLGFAAPAYRQSRLIFNMWYKLLPTLFYLASAYLLYRIARLLGMTKHRAKLCMFSFTTMPVAFFSQFIFSQYDIFTVFFMLLGIYYYLKAEDFSVSSKETVWFAASFGIAVTFKYFALLIFLILLFLREKNVFKWIPQLMIVAVPFVLEYLPFASSEGFQKGVFEFHVLDYVSLGHITTRLGSINLMQAGCVFMVIWAYLITPINRDELIRWILYICCGVCFAIFGFMTWHPQWLLFAAPFWVLSAFVSKDTEKFYWGNILFCIVWYLFIFQVWPGNVDETLLSHGIWKYVYAAHSVTVNTAYRIPQISITTLYSVIFAILMAYFVFAHPKYARENLSEEDPHDNMWLIRLQLVVSVLMFAIPTFYTVLSAA